MAENKFYSGIIYSVVKTFLALPENKSRSIGTPSRILIVRQHNQLGDLLTGVSLFRAVKETFPHSEITLIVSPFNYPGMVKNRFIDRIVIFNKKKLWNPFYIKNFFKTLREPYDIAIVPVVVSISFTSNLIARLSNSKIRIGANSLDGKPNKSAFLFDRRVDLDWKRHPDSNVSERSLDIVRPFGINTTNYRSEISFDEEDLKSAGEFLNSYRKDKIKPVIGLHVGAGKPQNRWSLLKYSVLIKKLKDEFGGFYYLTGSKQDKSDIIFVCSQLDFEPAILMNCEIPVVAAVISLSDLFICNDTGIMHVAGTTTTPQISVFGPTNPLNWAPLGVNKFFIRKSDLIDDISVDDVFSLCKQLLKSGNNL
ncbi:MAG: glycosyltransferase family 9 protein [Ignavibacteriaceae bacterium]